MTRTLVALCALAALAGCAPLTPHKAEDVLPPARPMNAAAAQERASTYAGWDDPAIRTEGQASVVLITPMGLPDSLRDRKVEIELQSGSTVEDLVGVLGHLGVPVITADSSARTKTFFLPRYKGTLGGLLSLVSRSTNTWFTWHDGAVVVSSLEKVGISVPQETGFKDTLTEGLKSLGVQTAAINWQAGMASLEVTPQQLAEVRTYLERMTSNAAVVTMQMAVINVTLKQDAKQGIDWDALKSAVTIGGAAAAAGTSLSLSVANGGLTGSLVASRFSFEGLFNFLQNYGITETKQNVLLKTVTGNKVEFKSLTQIPYVSQVGVTTTSTGSTTTGSTTTARADDGITVELTPSFDAAANSVTLDFSLSIKAVLAFNELSAGNQIGTLTQPTTAERSFTDKLRLRPGQTVVVGGLTYDSLADTRTSPLYLQKTKAESQALKVERQTTFIVLRPTVTRLGQLRAEDTSQSLDMIPSAVDPVQPTAARRPAKKGAAK